MKKNTNDTGLDAIRISGGLLSSSLLPHLRHYRLPGQKPADYWIERGLKLGDELGRYWRIAQARWQQFADLRKRHDLDPHTVTVDEWLQPLLCRVLGFQLRATPPLNIGERTFPVTHTAFTGAVPLVLTGCSHPLEAGASCFGEQGRKRSPAGLLQEYLNAEGRCLWGIVSNGLVLRLLRDNPAMTRPAYVEIDLDRIFAEELYVDFTVFWLLLHASRLVPPEGNPANCILEQWRNQGQTNGERVLGELRYGVTDALRILGTGFVAHPANKALREAITNEELGTEEYFQELLRLIYRFLFLFTTEDRNILLDPQADTMARDLYHQGYSTAVLRQRSRFRRYYDSHDDGWQQLLITFAGFATGEPRLAQPALGGLFAPDQCPHLEKSRLANRYLYEALFRLCYFETGNVLTRINYRDLDTEELGSVYESLLELIPRLDVTGQWRFGFLGDEANEDSGAGHSRKLTGSYYTPDSLVQELIRSALEPVITERLRGCSLPREALLNITVCDPACGSGHFLLAAARRLAAELARIDAGADQPTETDYRHALRQVISRCIYGVDINPLAVELCRTALWLEAMEPGKPLGFLDARIQVGNSLVGVLDPQLLKSGIPRKAFKPLSGDDRPTARELARRNKIHPSQLKLFATGTTALAACSGDFAAMPEDSLAQVEEKREAWLAMVQGDACRKEKLRADLFTAAFFAPKTAENAANVPTNRDLATLAQDGTIDQEMHRMVARLAREHRFFHWYLAFPEVIEQGGFDVLLGNPPWDMLQFDPKEFFSTRDSSIVDARHMAARQKMIDRLKEKNPTLYLQYKKTLNKVSRTQSFIHFSKRFPFTSRGRINLAPLFAELFTQVHKATGRAGIIVPSGIATDSFTQHFFKYISEQEKIVSLFDFENRYALFPGVHRSYKFCLLTLGNQHKPALLSFFLTHPSQLQDQRRCFTLTADEFGLINPNTRTCPVFRSRQDAELTKKIYRGAPILIREANDEEPAANPWGITFQLMFMMNTASHLFRTYHELVKHNGLFVKQTCNVGKSSHLPLYEAKMVHQYDHRWASYKTDGTSHRECTPEEKKNPAFHNRPRYWVDSWQVTLRTAHAPRAVLDVARHGNSEALREALTNWESGAELETAERFPLDPGEYEALGQLLRDQADPWPLTRELLERRQPRYLLGWRDITNATNERTVIAGIIPLAAVGHTFPLIFLEATTKQTSILLSNLNSLLLDFIARQKVGGTHLTYGYLKQFPILPPSAYTSDDLDFIVPRVLELTYTSHSLRPFALDLGYDGEPFPFDPERRHRLKSELDAYYARLYSLTRDELRYILDPADVMGENYPSETFRVLKNKELREFGEYRTRRLVLDAWDRLERGELQ